MKDCGRVRLVSRQGVDHTARFAALGIAITRLQAPTLILDGETGGISPSASRNPCPPTTQISGRTSALGPRLSGDCPDELFRGHASCPLVRSIPCTDNAWLQRRRETPTAASRSYEAKNWSARLAPAVPRTCWQAPCHSSLFSLDAIAAEASSLPGAGSPLVTADGYFGSRGSFRTRCRRQPPRRRRAADGPANRG